MVANAGNRGRRYEGSWAAEPFSYGKSRSLRDSDPPPYVGSDTAEGITTEGTKGTEKDMRLVRPHPPL